MSTPILRSFVVFRDDAPPSPTSSIASLADSELARPPSPPPSNGPSAPDKENRKEGVLATKAYVPPVPKKTKETKNSRSFGKEVSVAAPRSSAQPVKRRATSTRRNGTSSSSRPRRTPALPQVNEEQETELEPSNLRRAGLYLSKAFEQAPCLEGEHSLGEKLRPQELSKDAVEDAQSVYAASDRAPSPSPSVSSRGSSPSRSDAALSTFSTPERKRIYSAFTFSSPSPSSARYAALRGSNDARFSDPTFEL
ncbi:uncharacterized protein B0H18DRAFT_1122263 [Fomitopsis serialis]|uniref:uncharacterized protein n=1 Tax=Fomitopsis serialis TaxID=139415 RepID=UPI002008E0DA|nr:uncharacterized protein B0H18DRAFT_1122263 [Neoantrodia serialis]KAH9919824.1 hypothetical protein B0H18DRAFT_1122263 [Neoantrodia serialis]